MAGTRYPHGIDTEGSAVRCGDVVSSGEVSAKTMKAEGVISASAAKAISVNCTNDYALTAAQKNATNITISAAGSSKVLTLGMAAGQLITVINGGDNNVTVKNAAADTGVTATAAKTSIIIVTATEPIKIVETV